MSSEQRRGTDLSCVLNLSPDPFVNNNIGAYNLGPASVYGGFQGGLQAAGLFGEQGWRAGSVSRDGPAFLHFSPILASAPNRHI